MINTSLTKSADESELRYIYRIGTLRDNGLIDKTWAELADVMNGELRDPDEAWSESAYRKKYALMKQCCEEFGFKESNSEEEDLRRLREEIQKEKRKLYDQRREYNKLVVSDARAEHLTDELIEVAQQMAQKVPLLPHQVYHPSTVPQKEAVLCFSDWHYGLVTDNIWNKYDPEICRNRVTKLIKYVTQYLFDGNINTLHIVMLGDAAHGAIHTTCRVKAEEDTCDQLMHVAEILAETINELSDYVDEVKVYSCYGNHMRTIQNKSESVHSDNMEKIIPWWIKQRLKSNNKVEVVESEYKEFTKLNIFGYNICCVHGDLDNFKDIGVTVNTLFSRLFGETIDYTISGDKHHLEEFERFGIESILVRSLCGADDYANEKRLYAKPGQTLIVFNDVYGRECTYHIPLD